MEQFERSKRYLERIRIIYFGYFSSIGHDKDSYDDDVISFFIHCYHIRDWFIHLNTASLSAGDVDKYINSHLSLRICADLANGTKHCRLTRSLRTDRQPHIVNKQRETSTWVTSDGGGEYMKSKYSVMSGEELYDALDLAEDCMELWSQFFEEIKLRK